MEGPMSRNDTPVCPCTGPAIADAIAGELRRSGFPEGDVFICDADFAARSSDELSHGRAPSFAPMACAALRYHRHIGSGKQGTAAGSGAIIFGRHLGIWKARQIRTT